ncbi:amino acid permease-domain-containing protein [Fomes fomentarius]|nr:amino acid permease-domain-containing protein [Fomes fomentarius]
MPSLRERKPAKGFTPLAVRIQVPTVDRARLWPQTERVLEFQRRWERIKKQLPPQFSRKHSGVIGTGFFLGSADALRFGGPVGALLGYFIVGSIVYCLCVSVGEMIAFLPNVGGVVGLADLYVDPALGFSMGWSAWYNWSITLPTEITAATVVLNYWQEQSRLHVAVISAFFLVVATIINCFPARWYGEMEFILSCMKVTTIVVIIILSLLIDLGISSQGPIGFKYWIAQPFATNYLGIAGHKGQFLGFWAVIMQASFSFFGSEVAGIAAGEVIDASRNVPRALRKVWIRITLFYLGGVLCSGLLVPLNDPGLTIDDKTGRHSPFVIVFRRAGWKVLPDLVNAAILLSAWSAAAADIYISSRFLFFLAHRKHAPAIFAHLFRYPRRQKSGRRRTRRNEGSDMERSEDSDVGSNTSSDSDSGAFDSNAWQPRAAATATDEIPGEPIVPKQKYSYVLPLASVLTSSSVGLLTFLSYKTGSSAETVFSWLVSVASVASLQSWTAILFTYIRWHQGTVFYENKYRMMAEGDPEAEKRLKHIQDIKQNRHWGQPYMAWYAFILCMMVLLTNGWAVFVHNGWRIADIGEDLPVYDANQRLADPVSLFLSAYVPLPFFLLLTFGYKLIKQTRMISLDRMSFDPGRRPPPVPEEEPKGRLERVLAWLMFI